MARVGENLSEQCGTGLTTFSKNIPEMALKQGVTLFQETWE